MIKASAKISISRPSGGGKDVISISIRDTSSSVVVFEGEIGLAEFAEALTGLAERHINVEWRGLDRIGQRLETKVEMVPFKPDHYSRNKSRSEAEAVLRPFEVDGWVARLDDLFNHHRRQNGDIYAVSFHRYVP